MKNFDFHIAHIGINQENEEAALSAARTFETLFGFSYTVGNSSIFTADKRIEIMKKIFRGTYRYWYGRYRRSGCLFKRAWRCPRRRDRSYQRRPLDCHLSRR